MKFVMESLSPLLTGWVAGTVVDGTDGASVAATGGLVSVEITVGSVRLLQPLTIAAINVMSSTRISSGTVTMIIRFLVRLRLRLRLRLRGLRS